MQPRPCSRLSHRHRSPGSNPDQRHSAVEASPACLVHLTSWGGVFESEQGSVGTWLVGRGYWRICNELRRWQRRPREQTGVEDDEELFQQVLDGAPGPEERAFEKEHPRIVDSAMDALPPK